MPPSAPFSLFLFASAALVVVPGPAVFYIVTRSMTQGRGAGLCSVAGITLGNLAHVLAAAAGMSAILASSAAATAGVRYLGAGYLLWLGCRKLFGKSTRPGAVAPSGPESRGRLFGHAVVVATLNPKTTLFFVAFLPQFVDPGRGAIPIQLLMLGGITVAMGAVSDSVYALIAGRIGASLRSLGRFSRLGRYLAGATYCGLGFSALFTPSAKLN